MPALPKLVFQHFRDPQHLGPLSEPTAVGVMEGGRDGATIQFYLRVEPDQTVRVGFELKGDRSPVAALSLLTTYLDGRPLAEVEAVTVEDVAAHYGFDQELLPMLLRAHDALRTALAALRGDPDPFRADGDILCECLYVRRGRIERTIRERRLTTLAEVRHWTRACSGCRSCREDLEQLLREAGSA